LRWPEAGSRCKRGVSPDTYGPARRDGDLPDSRFPGSMARGVGTSEGRVRRFRDAAVGLALMAAPALAWAGGAAAQVAPYAGVTLEPDVQARLGVRTAVLKSERRSAQIDAFAKVLDPGPLAQLETDLEAAESTSAASAAEARRAQALSASGSAVARKDAEAAKAQADNDSVHV